MRVSALNRPRSLVHAKSASKFDDDFKQELVQASAVKRLATRQYVIPYSRKLLREKNFMDFGSATKVFSTKCWGRGTHGRGCGTHTLLRMRTRGVIHSRRVISFKPTQPCPCSSTFRPSHRYRNLMVPFQRLFLLQA